MIHLWIGLGILAVSLIVFVSVLMWEIYTKDERFDTPQQRFRLRVGAFSVGTAAFGVFMVLCELLILLVEVFFH